MAKNDVIRVSATNTTKAEKDRRAGILARAEAEANAEAKRLSWLWNPNNQSAEAMAMRDGPIESLTPEVLGMIAMDVPAKWATNAAWKGLKKVLGFAGRGAGKGGQLTLDDLVKIYNEDPGRLPFKRSVSKADIEAFDALKKDISDWYIARKGVIDAAGRDTGIPDTLEGFLAGVRDAKLVDTSGVDTVLTSATLGDDLGKTLTLGVQKPVSSMPRSPGVAIDPIIYDTASEIALSDPLTLNLAKGAETVYHEVGGHAASRGAKATTISRAIQANNEAAARMRALLDDPSSPVVDNFKARMARNDAFRSLRDALENNASSAEKIVEIVRDKYGVPAGDLGYLDKPSEVMSRVWELRRRTGVAPKTSWTPKFVSDMRKTGNLKELHLDNWTDEALAELANRMPAVAAPLAAAEAAERRQAAKGGDAPDPSDRFKTSRNFLATDKVPDTIFGIPIVSRREDYTEADIAFFKEHPEAGGYYDMGEGTPEDGSDEGAPVQNDVPKSQLPSATFITGGRDEFDTVEMVQQALKNNYSAEQFLRMYYGDATDRIVGRAKELRGMTAQDMSHLFDLRDYQAVDRGSADPEARSLPRYASGGPRGVIVFPDLPIIAVGPGAVQTNEITKEVMTNIERAAHTELPPLATYENVFGQNMAAIRKHSRDNVVLATQKQLYRDMEKWLKEEGKRGFEDGRYVYLGSKEDGPHEVSHLLNPNEDLRYAVQYGPTYYLQNDAELAAAISAARREIFKRSGGKIDIADPRHMRAVLNEVKPGATDEETKAKRAPYEGRWLSTEARKFLYNYWTFKGSSRAADVNRKVVDPEFTGKLVSAKRPRKDRV